MKSLLFLMLILIVSFAQDKLHVYVDTQNNKIARFEKQIVRNVVNLLDSKHKSETDVSFDELKSFSEAFTVVSNAKNELVIAINKISYTEERAKKFSFSSPYMFNFYSIMTLKENKEFLNDKDFLDTRIYGAVSGTIFDDKVKEIAKKGIKYKLYRSTAEMAKALQKKDIDLMISDYVDSWEYDLASVFLYDDDKVDKLCILFTKDSKYLSEFNEILEYYIKSQAYMNLIKDFFGAEAVTFFKKIN